MNISQALTAFYHKRLNFHGRSRRAEFWWVTLAYTLATIVAITIDVSVLGYHEEALLTPSLAILEFILLVPMTALTARRLHDVGMTGWAQLPSFFLSLEYVPAYEGFLLGGFESEEPARIILTLVFMVYLVWILFYMVKDGQSGRNRYGDNPKEQPLSDVFD